MYLRCFQSVHSIYSFQAEQISEENYIYFRCWVGLWLTIICVLVAVFELSFVLKFFTRFTEEIFAMIVSLIYIVSVIENLIKIFEDYPVKTPDYCDLTFTSPDDGLTSTCISNTDTCNAILDPFQSYSNQSEEYCCHIPPEEKKTPTTALMSLIFTSGCFVIAYQLKMFRSSRFLSSRFRKMLGDFGVPIAILIMTGIDLIINGKIFTKVEFSSVEMIEILCEIQIFVTEIELAG